MDWMINRCKLLSDINDLKNWDVWNVYTSFIINIWSLNYLCILNENKFFYYISIFLSNSYCLWAQLRLNLFISKYNLFLIFKIDSIRKKWYLTDGKIFKFLFIKEVKDGNFKYIFSGFKSLIDINRIKNWNISNIKILLVYL